MSIYSEKSNVGLRHLRAAIAIAEEGSFASAAFRLSVVPSALTETIRQIEQESGVILFNRERRPISPTSEGSTFLAEAAQIVRGFDSALHRLRQIGGKHAGQVAIAVAPSLLQRFLGPSILEFRARYPNVHLVIRDDVAGKVEELAVSGEVDLALASRWRQNPDIDYAPIGEDLFGLACHESHPLAGTGVEIHLEDIDPGQIISLRQDTGITQILEASSAISDRLRHGRLTVQSTIAQLLLISQNLGVALLPEYAVGVLASAGVVYRPIYDLHLGRELYLMRRRNITMSPASLSFYNFLIERKDAGSAL